MSVSKVEIDQGAEVMKCVLNAGLQKGFGPMSKLLDVIKKIGGKALPVIGFVLEVVDFIWPDNSKHEEIMNGFKKLSDKLDLVRRDIKELEKLIEWESAKQQYTIAVTDLKVGMEYVYGLSTSKDNPARYAEWKNRLLLFGRNPALTRAINLLATGLSGGADLQADILKRFYNVSHGNRPKMITLASRLVTFLCGGLITLMVYEILEYNLDAAKDLMNKLYTHKLVQVNAYVYKMVDLCVKNFHNNLQWDLEKGMGDNSGKHNKEISHNISLQVWEKYDWLKQVVNIIYDDLWGFDNHTIGGARVEKFHYKNKINGVIWYWDKNRPIENHHRAPEVLAHAKMVADRYTHARSAWDAMAKFMESKKIKWSGLGVIKRNSECYPRWNFSGGRIWHGGRNFSMCIILT